MTLNTPTLILLLITLKLSIRVKLNSYKGVLLIRFRYSGTSEQKKQKGLRRDDITLLGICFFSLTSCFADLLGTYLEAGELDCLFAFHPVHPLILNILIPTFFNALAPTQTNHKNLTASRHHLQSHRWYLSAI